jgi:hypothetical protein
MGLAVRKALPIAVAAALMCPPLAAKHAQVKPIRSADIKGRPACVALQLVLAGPLYSEAEKSEAEKLYGTVGRSRNALYAKIGRVRSEWETMSFPEVSEYLATLLDNEPKTSRFLRDDLLPSLFRQGDHLNTSA